LEDQIRGNDHLIAEKLISKGDEVTALEKCKLSYTSKGKVHDSTRFILLCMNVRFRVICSRNA